jgi:hypothetical protein
MIYLLDIRDLGITDKALSVAGAYDPPPRCPRIIFIFLIIYMHI